MRTVLAIVGALVLNIVAFGQSAQTPAPKPQPQEQQSSDILYENIPVKRGEAFKRPKISMQRALEMAEDYIRKENIDIAPYYLREAKLVYPDPQRAPQEKYWWFWWMNETGVFGDYVEVGVAMDGRIWRIPSM